MIHLNVVKILLTLAFLLIFIAELTLDRTTTFVRLSPNSQHQVQFIDHETPAPVAEILQSKCQLKDKQVRLSVETLTHSALPIELAEENTVPFCISAVYPNHINCLLTNFIHSRIERPPIS